MARRGKKTVRAALRKIAKTTLVTLGVLLGTVGMVLAALWLSLFSETASAFIATQGVGLYDGMVPGRVEVESVENSFAEGLVLRDVALYDATDNLLASIEALELGLSPWPLLSGRIVVEKLGVRGANIRTPSEAGELSYADLAPVRKEKTPEEEKPPEPLHVEVPIPVILEELSLKNIYVERLTQRGGLERVLALEDFALGLRAFGDRAHLAVTRLEGSVPPASLRVQSGVISLRLRDGHAVSVPIFEVDTNYGDLSFASADLDLRRMAVSLSAEFRSRMSRLTGRSPEKPKVNPVTAHIDLSGSPEDFVANLEASVDRSRLSLDAAGSLQPRVDVAGNLAVASFDAADVGAPVSSDLNLRGSYDLEIGQGGGVRAWGRLGCADCVVEGIALEAFNASVDYGPQGLRAEATLRSEPMKLDARLERRRGDLIQGRGRLEISNLGEVTRALAGQAINGSLVAEATCRQEDRSGCRASIVARNIFALSVSVERLEASGQVDLGEEPTYSAEVDATNVNVPRLRLTSLDIDASGGADQVEASLQARSSRGRSARLQGVVAFGDPLAVRLNELKSDLFGVGVRLKKAATAEIARRRIRADVPGLALAGGLVALHGSVVPEGPLDVSARIDHVNAGRLASLAGVRAEGIVSADLRVDGTLARPDIKGSVSARKVAWKDLSLGRLRLDTSYSNRRADIDLTATCRGERYIELDARVPVVVDVEKGRYAHLRRRRHLVSWDVSAPADEIVSVFLEEQGIAVENLRSKAKIEGTIRAPRGSIGLAATVDGLTKRSLPAEIELSISPEQQSLDARLVRGGKRVLVARLESEIDVSKLVDGIVDVDSLELRGEYNGGTVQMGGQMASMGDADLLLAIERLDLDALRYELGIEGIGGMVHASAEAAVERGRPRAVASLDWMDASFGGHDIGRAVVDASVSKTTAFASVALLRNASPLFEAEATIPVELDIEDLEAKWHPHEEHRIRFAIDDLQARHLAPWVDLPGDLDFAISKARGELRGSLYEPRGSVSLHSLLSPSRNEEIRADLRLNVDPHRQSLEVNFQDAGALVASLDVDAAADIRRIAAREVEPTETPFDLTLRANGFPLELIDRAALGDEFQIAGRFNADIEVAGTPARPKVNGAFNVQDGAFGMLSLSDPLENLELAVRAYDDEITIVNFEAWSGGGVMKMAGDMKIDRQIPAAAAAFRLKTDSFGFAVVGMPQTFISTDVKFESRVSPAGAVADVDIKGAKVLVAMSDAKAPQAIPKNDNLKVIRDHRPAETADQPAEEETEEEAEAGEALPVEISVAITEPVLVTGPLLTTVWDGAIEVTRNQGGVGVDGTVSIEKGWIDILGNRFEVQRGKIRFPEEEDPVPFLDILAVANTSYARVEARISGRATSPKVSLSSVPQMEDEEIFTLLVAGTPDMNRGDQERLQAQAATAGTGLFALQFHELQQKINRRLGVDAISFGFGESTDEPVVNIGKWISPSIYLEARYHHNAPEDENEAEVAVEVTLSPHWTVESYTGDSNVSGVDLFWHTVLDAEDETESESDSP